LRETAAKLKIEIAPLGVQDASEVEGALSDAPGAPVDGLVMADSWLMVDYALIADVAQKHSLPSIGAPSYSAAGALLGYGSDFVEMCRDAAMFVDKILKGAKPGDIPIDQATKFITLVNLKTARALGVDIPPTLLAAADEVIE
jgi:putative tryptophan/tyrosine transport system substrate-binding protein